MVPILSKMFQFTLGRIFGRKEELILGEPRITGHIVPNLARALFCSLSVVATFVFQLALTGYELCVCLFLSSGRFRTIVAVCTFQLASPSTSPEIKKKKANLIYFLYAYAN